MNVAIRASLTQARAKAQYCRDKAAELLAAVDRASSPQAQAEMAAVANQWSALALHYERQIKPD
jgi:hypothetical protein